MPAAAEISARSRRVIPVPATMQAAVYRGLGDVRTETVKVPGISGAELLVQVDTCGICGTDLKKIATGSHSAPRVFGHEMSGTVVRAGAEVTNFSIGDRVMVFHHIPCGSCYYCHAGTFAQCETYKQVGAGAGIGEPSGGGFAEYVKVADWIVRRGVVKLPDHVSFEQASFIEPVNTCLKGIRSLRLQAGETVLVIGQGPIGIILALLARREGARVVVTELHPARLAQAGRFGLSETIHAGKEDIVSRARQLTEGRGADAVIVAVGGDSAIRPAMDAARPGGRVMLFAQTQPGEVAIDPAAVCRDEKTLMGSYSASVDLQDETAGLVFDGGIAFERLISHRFPLARATEAIALAANPQPDSMKVVIQPAAPESRTNG